MEHPTSWDDRSPLNYGPLEKAFTNLIYQRPRRGDTSWKSRIVGDLRKNAASKKAVETWLGQAFAKLIEEPSPRLELSKGPWKEADFAVFVEFYHILYHDTASWEAEAFLNRIRRDRGLKHGIRNDGASDPQTWGQKVVRIATAKLESFEGSSITPVASSSRSVKRKSPEDSDETKKKAIGKGKEATPPAKKRRGRPPRATGRRQAKQAIKSEEEENDKEPTGDTDAEGELDGEERPEKVERVVKKRKTSSPESAVSDLTEVSDAAKSPDAGTNDARGSTKEEGSVAMEEDSPEEEEEEAATSSRSKSKGMSTSKAAAKKTPAKRGRKSKASKAKDAELPLEDEEEIAPTTPTPEEIQTDPKEDAPLKSAVSKGKKTAGKGRASTSTKVKPTSEDMDVDEPAGNPAVQEKAQNGKASILAGDSLPKPATDAPPPTTDDEDPPSSPLTDDFTPPPESHFQESDLRNAPPSKTTAKTSAKKAKKPASKAKAPVEEKKEVHPPRSEPAAPQPPPSKTKPTSKAPVSKATAPLPQVKPQEDKKVTAASVPPSPAKVAKPSPPKVLTALAMDYGSDDDDAPSRQVSLSPSPSELDVSKNTPQQTTDDVPATKSQSSPANKPTGDSSSPAPPLPNSEPNGTPVTDTKTRRSSRRNKQTNDNGLAAIYNNVFTANASLNKQATQKGQEYRFNSEAGSAQ
jgi:histone H1/5